MSRSSSIDDRADRCDRAADCLGYNAAAQVMPVARPSSGQCADKEIDEGPRRYLADARLGAGVTVTGR